MTSQKIMLDRRNRQYSLYRHTSPSGKVYIGITSQPVEHRWNGGKGYMNVKSSLIKSAIIKYGWDNIKHEILFTNLTKEEAIKLEIELIAHYKSLGISLNITSGGDGCADRTPWNKGKKVPYEKSSKLRGKKLSDEHRRKLSESHKGKGHPNTTEWTEEMREYLSKLMKGRKHTQDAKEKISKNSTIKRMVKHVTSDGITIEIFDSIRDASKKYMLDESWLRKCCISGKPYKGLYFKFI